MQFEHSIHTLVGWSEEVVDKDKLDKSQKRHPDHHDPQERGQPALITIGNKR